MKKLKCVQVYRDDEKEQVWNSHQVHNVFCCGMEEAFLLDDSMDRDTKIVLRVIGNPNCDIAPGDRVYYQKCSKAYPPEDCCVVVGVVRFEHGYKTSHAKILCR